MGFVPALEYTVKLLDYLPKLLMERAKVINSGTWLIPDGFCFLDPLEELSILRNMLFRSMSV